MVVYDVHEKSAAKALKAHLSLKTKSSHCSVEEWVLTTYRQVVSYLFEAYPKPDIIPEKAR